MNEWDRSLIDRDALKMHIGIRRAKTNEDNSIDIHVFCLIHPGRTSFLLDIAMALL